jgi:hypothetical protein
MKIKLEFYKNLTTAIVAICLQNKNVTDSSKDIIIIFILSSNLNQFFPK